MRPLQLLARPSWKEPLGKGGCLDALMADARWHGRVTGLSVGSRLASQVLRNLLDSMLRRMHSDMLLVKKNSNDGTQPSVYDL